MNVQTTEATVKPAAREGSKQQCVGAIYAPTSLKAFYDAGIQKPNIICQLTVDKKPPESFYKALRTKFPSISVGKFFRTATPNQTISLPYSINAAPSLASELKRLKHPCYIVVCTVGRYPGSCVAGTKKKT